MPYDSHLLRVNTLGSDEGSMILQELMVFYTTLSKKVKSLETDLKQTKKIYGAAYTRLVKKGRKIATIDQDPGILLVQHDVEIHGRYGHDMEFDFDFNAAKEVSTTEKDVSIVKPVSTASAAVTTASVAFSTVSPTRNTIVSIADDITMAGTMVYIRKSVVKDKGKGKMVESETVQTKTKLQQEQERLYFEVAVRLQAELEEEERAYQPEKEQLRGYFFDKIKTLFETIMRKVNTFVPIESEVDRAVLKLAAESSKRAAEEELDQESSKRQKTGESSELAEEPRDKEADELSQEELQQMMIIVPEQGMNSLVKEKFNSTEPTDDKEREIWLKLKRLFEPDTDDELWKLQKKIHDLTWRLYDSCGVHHVYTEEGIDIYMLVEKEYPLSRGTLTLMLVA
ncbi:hypothetical protein Tco_0728639 [Tanacetum coccineum]|uniref:Uncharacterized protein n=1 Tax=Tanacetum coccineum TaxID=301880 RepID=A0ABQ4YQ56_9ASTR